MDGVSVSWMGHRCHGCTRTCTWEGIGVMDARSLSTQKNDRLKQDLSRGFGSTKCEALVQQLMKELKNGRYSLKNQNRAVPEGVTKASFFKLPPSRWTRIFPNGNVVVLYAYLLFGLRDFCLLVSVACAANDSRDQ